MLKGSKDKHSGLHLCEKK